MMNLKMAVFELPDALNATTPPERRGVRRDHVKLLVVDRKTGAMSHSQFYKLNEYLQAGDLLVLNASRTIPGVMYGKWKRNGTVMADRTEIRLARRLNEQEWEVFAVAVKVNQGDILEFTSTLSAVVTDSASKPFIRINFSLQGAQLTDQIYACAEPVRYEYISRPWELDYYQTVYASAPGSVEMPSAGRAFSWELLFKLKHCGIRTAFIQLHTGLSYLLDGTGHLDPEQNYEQFDVPAETAAIIRQTKQAGGRIIAVGTTVVRALESAVSTDYEPVARSGWTNLMIDRTVPLRIADGLISGFHEPEASHLDLLSAFIAPELLYRAYETAIEQKYLWHEFGDMNLIL